MPKAVVVVFILVLHLTVARGGHVLYTWTPSEAEELCKAAPQSTDYDAKVETQTREADKWAYSNAPDYRFHSYLDVGMILKFAIREVDLKTLGLEVFIEKQKLRPQTTDNNKVVIGYRGINPSSVPTSHKPLSVLIPAVKFHTAATGTVTTDVTLGLNFKVETHYQDNKLQNIEAWYDFSLDISNSFVSAPVYLLQGTIESSAATQITCALYNSAKSWDLSALEDGGSANAAVSFHINPSMRHPDKHRVSLNLSGGRKSRHESINRFEMVFNTERLSPGYKNLLKPFLMEGARNSKSFGLGLNYKIEQGYLVVQKQPAARTAILDADLILLREILEYQRALNLPEIRSTAFSSDFADLIKQLSRKVTLQDPRYLQEPDPTLFLEEEEMSSNDHASCNSYVDTENELGPRHPNYINIPEEQAEFFKWKSTTNDFIHALHMAPSLECPLDENPPPFKMAWFSQPYFQDRLKCDINLAMEAGKLGLSGHADRLTLTVGAGHVLDAEILLGTNREGLISHDCVAEDVDFVPDETWVRKVDYGNKSFNLVKFVGNGANNRSSRGPLSLMQTGISIDVGQGYFNKLAFGSQVDRAQMAYDQLLLALEIMTKYKSVSWRSTGGDTSDGEVFTLRTRWEHRMEDIQRDLHTLKSMLERPESDVSINKVDTGFSGPLDPVLDFLGYSSAMQCPPITKLPKFETNLWTSAAPKDRLDVQANLEIKNGKIDVRGVFRDVGFSAGGANFRLTDTPVRINGRLIASQMPTLMTYQDNAEPALLALFGEEGNRIFIDGRSVVMHDYLQLGFHTVDVKLRMATLSKYMQLEGQSKAFVTYLSTASKMGGRSMVMDGNLRIGVESGKATITGLDNESVIFEYVDESVPLSKLIMDLIDPPNIPTLDGETTETAQIEFLMAKVIQDSEFGGEILERFLAPKTSSSNSSRDEKVVDMRAMGAAAAAEVEASQGKKKPNKAEFRQAFDDLFTEVD